MKDAEEANLDEEGLHDIEIEGDTEEKTTPFHKKLMRDAIKGERTTSSAAKLAASIRQKKKDTEREEQLSLKSKGESLGLNKKSGGPRSQWNEVSRLSKLQPSTVASILKRSVIYDNGDVVVINKPYGLPVHVYYI
ncbi:Mitochondrial RNA pseudouridine synthase Rpusd4 [Holothuria leucospilota]|uniref:Mitochondrial RNA pseudouridine synthase Rpusd4 n=1 Tax=Holothuria leucospilota TaxID=206669 RepID=A0A9Q1HF13_HOLLE|nr:Mitochondrial RNA pseudouridine synthase Rpusd4 [Holothuria leucospilota]